MINIFENKEQNIVDIFLMKKEVILYLLCANLHPDLKINGPTARFTF